LPAPARPYYRGEGLPADRKPFKLVVIKGGKVSAPRHRKPRP
jgi:hypothetical protein